MKIVHVITGLQTGGAEMLLARVAPLQQARGHSVEVVCLTQEGPQSAKLATAGISVSHLNARGPWGLWQAYRRLRQYLREQRPDVVHTWLYHADLIGGLAARACGVPVVWALHHAGVARHELKLSTYLIVRWLARLSRRLPQRILSCSQLGLEAHAALGYARHKLSFLPNGTDCQHFQPHPGLGERLREKIGIPASALVVGIAARYHSVKDYPNFFAAAVELQQTHPQIHFLACGQGVEPSSPEIQVQRLPQNLHLLGAQQDLPAFYSALDIFTLSSRTEAFPLTLGEAMACERPCVSPAVGDAASLLSDTGKLCPPQDPVALAAAWRSLLELSSEQRSALGKRARQRIVEHFSMEQLLDGYEAAYAL
jgi:glycosyltransferase involved in cell wall biosynthesis